MENNQNQAQKSEKNWYDKIHKIILIIPAIMLLFSLVYLFNFNAKNGDLIYKDVSLTGGTTITVFDEGVNVEDLKSALKADFPDLIVRKILDIRTRNQQAFIVETKSGAEEAKAALEKYLGYPLNQDNSSIEFSGSTI